MKKSAILLISFLTLICLIFSKTALILGGGGAAGAYELGVLKYIKEHIPEKVIDERDRWRDKEFSSWIGNKKL